MISPVLLIYQMLVARVMLIINPVSHCGRLSLDQSLTIISRISGHWSTPWMSKMTRNGAEYL